MVRIRKLKQQLLQPQIARLPDPERHLTLVTNGIRFAVGAALKQRFDHMGLEHPVSFFSRALTSLQRKYAAYKVELFAVMLAFEHFRMFLLGKEFFLRTDNAPLRNLFRRDLPPTSRVERWILRFSEYSFKIEYQKGQDNVIADVFSRLPFASAENVEKHTGLDNAPWNVNSPESLVLRPSSLENSSNTLIISDAIRECDDSDKSLVCSENSSSECNLEQSECKIYSNSNYLYKFPEHPQARAFEFLDGPAPLTDLPISLEGVRVDDFQIPTSEEFATAQSADSELRQLRRQINKQITALDQTTRDSLSSNQ